MWRLKTLPMWRLKTLITFLIFAISAASSVYANEQTRRESKQCADFLSELGRSHERLEFVQCERSAESQLRVLRAIYRVSGANAAALEQHFIKTARMGQLRFVCCVWEVSSTQPIPTPRYGEYRAGNDQFKISMASVETLIRERSRWAEIPTFRVEVVYFVDLP